MAELNNRHGDWKTTMAVQRFHTTAALTKRKFQVGCPKNSECKTAKVSCNLNPPIESKLSRDNNTK